MWTWNMNLSRAERVISSWIKIGGKFIWFRCKTILYELESVPSSNKTRFNKVGIRCKWIWSQVQPRKKMIFPQRAGFIYLYRPFRNSGEMTIGKTHPTLHKNQIWDENFRFFNKKFKKWKFAMEKCVWTS